MNYETEVCLYEWFIRNAPKLIVVLLSFGLPFALWLSA